MAGFKTLIDGLTFTKRPRWHDGRLLVSDFYTRRVLAISTDGKAETIACMLSGDDGRTLFACAAPTSHEDEASTNRRAAILYTTVDVPHGGLP